MWLTIHVTSAAAGPNSARADPPSAAPIPRPSRIRTCSGIRRRARRDRRSFRRDRRRLLAQNFPFRSLGGIICHRRMDDHQRTAQSRSTGSPRRAAGRPPHQRSAAPDHLPQLRKSAGSKRTCRTAGSCDGAIAARAAKSGRGPWTSNPERAEKQRQEHMSETRIGWIGTGVMGLSMCGHLHGEGLSDDDL